MPLFGPPNVQKLEAKGNVKGLIKALRYEKSPFIRHDAVEALGKIGDHRAVEPLITVLKDKSFFGRKAAAIALGEIGDSRAVDPLIGALEDKSEDVRKAAAGALGKIGDPRAINPLIDAFKDEHREVQREAVKAVGEFGDIAIESLVESLKYSTEYGSYNCVTALSNIGATALEHILLALKDPSWLVRRHTVKVLGEIGDSRAVDPLIGALKDKNEDVRAATAQALGSIGDERALAALQCALNDESEKASLAALNALVKFGKPLVDEPTFQEREKEAVELESLFSRLTNIKIKPAYDSSGNEVSYAFNLECGDVFAAVKEIGSSGDPRAVPELCKWAERYSSIGSPLGMTSGLWFLKAVLEALGEIGAPSGVGFLLQHWDLQPAAGEALSKIAHRHGLSTETVQWLTARRDSREAVQKVLAALKNKSTKKHS